MIDSPSVANKILAGAGIVLIILGTAALVEKENSVQIPAGVGILAISAGVVLTIFGFRKKT